MAQNGAEKKFDRAIEALLTAGTITAAAQQAKISRRTLTRWLGDPAFQRRLQDTRRELLRHGTSRLCGLLAKAIDAISVALDGQKITKARYLSARLVIETAIAIGQDDIEQRVTDLEQRLRERRPGYDPSLENLSIEQLKNRLRMLRREIATEALDDDGL